MGTTDYFEADRIVKGYDGRIVRRILAYIKPYRLLSIAALAALALSTLGELALPVLMQRVIDGAILAKYLAIDLESVDSRASGISPRGRELLEELLEDKRIIRIGTRAFLKQDASLRIGKAVEEELRSLAILDRDTWYVYEDDGKGPAVDVLREGSYGALRSRELQGLSKETRRLLRVQDIHALRGGMVLFLGILLLVLFSSFAQTWTTTLMGQRVMKDLRLALFEGTARQSTAYLSRHPVGRIVTRLCSDVETINEFFTSVLVAFLKDLSIMAGVLCTLFLLSPSLALITLCTLPPVVVATAISRVKARDAFRAQRIASSRVNAFLSERLSGVQVVQLFGQEVEGSRAFMERNGELLRANLGEMYVFAAFRPVVDFLASATLAVVIAAGASMLLGLSLSLGVLIAFINMVQMFYDPVKDIAEKYTILQSAMAGGERVFEFLDADEAIPDKGTLGGSGQGHIEFDKVCFSYKKGEPILKDLSFTVEAGERLAIVGYTGAGKTTITKLLTRLWDLDDGVIRLDGKPVGEYRLDELRRTVLPVLQEVFLFSGTVADNIRLGLDLSDQAVEAAAKAVHAHAFISKLPKAYATILSEGATNISSGQRQLISFARVIAHNPAIVILDEATSSVDTETEHLIQLGIQRILSGRTSIVIAHRLSTIRHADRILVLSNGTLVEEGTHKALIRQNGLYASLYRLQYQGADS